MFVRLNLCLRLILVGLCFAATPATPATAEPIALAHVTVIDPANSTPSQPDQTVLIVDGRIASVSATSLPADARVIDARGKFLIPGLCDMHVHLAGVPNWQRRC